MNKRTILFIHQAFPGQFASLAASLAAEGHRVFALAMNPQGRLPGVRLIRYQPIRAQKNAEEMPRLLQEADAKLIRGQSAYQVMKAMKAQGVEPDIVYAHPGWGDAMFVRNVWPDARYVVHAEWFYNAHGQEVNFDPAFPSLSEEDELRLSVKNDPLLQALSQCDAAITPTVWQKERFPAWAREKIRVVHEGFNLAELSLVKPRSLGIPSQNLKLTRGMPILTYSARYLEPVRGFHYFMRSLPLVLDAVPGAHVVVMGQDAGVNNRGYGANNPAGASWRATMEQELAGRLDLSRVHFLGSLERNLYLAVLKLSACHVYLTAPFILSWSFLEAAALGLPIVASDTAPVREFAYLNDIRLVPFDDPQAIAAAAIGKLRAVDKDYDANNIQAMKDLDVTVTLPKIRKILLEGSGATDIGGKVESVVFMDD